MKRIIACLSAAAALLTAGAPATAQQADAAVEPAVYIGVQGLYARPVGEFRDYVKHGGGLNVSIAWPVTRGNPFALRADGGFIVYGSETRRVCFGGGVGCFIQLDLTTTNSIAYFNVGPQLMLPDGAVRPYVNGAIGAAYFGTTSSVSGTNNDEDFASTTNFDDVTFSWNAGGGLLIRLGGRPGRPVLLDIGSRYHGNGEVEYLKKGDITEGPGGELVITPTRSAANLVTFQLGVSVGVGGR